MELLRPESEDEFKLRRSFAIQSFYLNAILLVFVLLFIVFGDAGMVARLTSAQFIISALITANVANFAHYGHSVHRARGKNEYDSD